MDDFSIYLAEHPEDPEAYFNRGVAYSKSGSFDFALRDFNRTIDLEPKHEKAFFERAFVKKNLNDLIGYKSDLQTSYSNGYLYAYHFLKDA